jgi:hypothetical protein
MRKVPIDGEADKFVGDAVTWFLKKETEGGGKIGPQPKRARAQEPWAGHTSRFLII